MNRTFCKVGLTLTVLTVVGLVGMALAPRAGADQSYHTEQLALHPVGGEPLHTGFVINIHANGPEIYALERYVLVGARPNTTYQVYLLLFRDTTDCSANLVDLAGGGRGIPTQQLQTNGEGNGEAHFVIPPEIPTALGLRPAPGNPPRQHGVEWQVRIVDEHGSVGQVAYETDCSIAILD